MNNEHSLLFSERVLIIKSSMGGHRIVIEIIR